MAYFRKIGPKLDTLLELFTREERWLILVNADPDALASAMALRRMMTHRVKESAIAQVNTVSRPDNLAMIRSLRIPTQKLTPNLAVQYDRYALVDSQPHHHPAFKEFSFSLVLDHHPLVEEEPALADYKDIQPKYGANATLMTEYLYNLNIRPGKLLATALLFGIKSDTASFTRSFCDVDVRAFRYLSKFANPHLMQKIVNSDLRLEWLSYFPQAFVNMHQIGRGMFTYMNQVDTSDLLVALADFFLRVNEFGWTTVAGINDDKLIVIFRGDGITRDMGHMANKLFGSVGSAGGHKAMARAEIPLKALPNVPREDLGDYAWKKLSKWVGRSIKQARKRTEGKKSDQDA